jgi:4-amino-4-deoxy-L-arabinose transferase-like glycosyltransferase
LKNFKLIFFISLIVKLILAAAIPLTSDEAYYWVWSHRMQLSFFDHPPAVAWLFWIGHFFENLGSAVRWPGVILGHLTLLVWYLIWQEISNQESDRKRWPWWLAVVLFSPLLGFGSLIVTPDLPVLFFWATSLLFFLRLLKSKKAFDYALFGASLGLGFCSKYHIVLFVPIALTYLVVEKKLNQIVWKNVLLTIFFGLLFCSPVLIWNFQNDFASFRFQLQHGLVRNEYRFYWTWSYVLSQIVILFPVIVWRAMKARIQGVARMMYYFAWGPLLFFFLSSFKALVEANWPVVAYPAFIAVAVLGASRFKPFLFAVIFWIFIFVAALTHLLFPWIPSAPDKFMELTQFAPLKEKTKQYQPLYASTYQMASWIWFETKTPIYKLQGISRHDLFDTFPEGQPRGFPFYLAMKRETEMPNWILEDSDIKITEIENLENDLVVVKVDK